MTRMTDERPLPPEPVPAPSEQNTLQPEPMAPPAWMPPPPPAPPTQSLWHRLAATLVLVAVVAASAGAGIRWGLARGIEAPARPRPAATPAEGPLQPPPGG